MGRQRSKQEVTGKGSDGFAGGSDGVGGKRWRPR